MASPSSAANHPPDSAESEQSSLIDAATPPTTLRGARRAVAGTVLALALLAAVAVKRALTPCRVGLAPEADEPPSLVSLAEAFPEDLVNLASSTEARDDALEKWLANANAASSAAGAGGGVDPEMADKAVQVIRQAMDSEDPAEAQRFVKRTMQRAVQRTQEKRRELKRLAASGKTSFLQHGDPNQRDLKSKKSKGQMSPSDQAAVATCFFDTASLVRQVAFMAANINDASKTCEDVKANEFFKAHDAHTKVCSINVAAIVSGVVSLASGLASAVDSCAMTLIPNVDALCAVSITGLMTAVSSLGGSCTLMAAACRTNGWYAKIPAGVTPSNVGSNERYEGKKAGLIPEDGRRLDEGDEGTALNVTHHAPPRQLLFGGGKGSMATQCVTSVWGLAWAMAYIGLNINSAANQAAGPSCPPKSGSPIFPKLIHKATQNLCNVDISGALVSFFGIILYSEWIAYQCTDSINIAAICGSGATALLAAMAGISKASSGMYLTCDLAQKPTIKLLIDLITKFDAAGWLPEGITNNFGRRLIEETHQKFEEGLWDAEIEKLKQQYSSPAEAWKSIGIDFDDPDADFRKHGEGRLDEKEMVSLVEEQPQSKSAIESFFQGGQTCS